MEKLIRVAANVPPQVSEQLELLSSATGISVSKLVTWAVESYLRSDDSRPFREMATRAGMTLPTIPGEVPFDGV